LHFLEECTGLSPQTEAFSEQNCYLPSSQPALLTITPQITSCLLPALQIESVIKLMPVTSIAGLFSHRHPQLR